MGPARFPCRLPTFPTPVAAAKVAASPVPQRHAGSLSRPAATPIPAGWPLSGDARNSGCARARPPAAARVGRGRGRDKAAGRGPHLSSQKVQGECSGTPTGSGRSADSGRPRGSPAPGGAAAGGSAMFSAGQAADARTRAPSSLPAPAPPRPRPAPTGLGPAPTQQRPAGPRPEQGTRERRAEEESPGWPRSWGQGQMEGPANGSVWMESQSPTVPGRKKK